MLKEKETMVEENSAKIEEVKPKKRKFNKKYFLFYIAGIAFIIWASITLVNQGEELKDKKTELAVKTEQLEVEEMNIEDYKATLNKLIGSGKEKDDLYRKEARKMDYVENGERVFVTISGD